MTGPDTNTDTGTQGHLTDLAFQSGEVPILLRPKVLVGLVLGFLLMVAAYFAAVQIFDLSLSIDAEPFQEWVDGWGLLGPLVYMVVLAASVLFAPIPNLPIFIAAGLAWGPVLGTVYSMGGMMLGSAAAFWVSRRLGRGWLPRLIGISTAARLDDLATRMGGRVIFWARMLPVVNFDFISFLAGLTAIRFSTFFLYSFLGMLLPTTIAVIAGDSLGKDVRVTISLGGVWVAGIVLSAGYFYWSRRRSQGTPATAPQGMPAGDRES
ncbi:MAG: TVP38/TMEM64 family protein [Dehalococcoidia bacterium]|nr:TVP38/TMEM64 family protein [Dehalococcoidia bacterium]MCA9852651.1 TVP38/TMEM64 family protein [Dehalococcoidia bacterium]